jgi:hypothetical protein
MLWVPRLSDVVKPTGLRMPRHSDLVTKGCGAVRGLKAFFSVCFNCSVLTGGPLPLSLYLSGFVVIGAACAGEC